MKHTWNIKARQAVRLLFASGLAIMMAFVSTGAATAAAQAAGNDRMQLFSHASEEFGVPQEILLAVSYNVSRLTPHGDMPSNDNGYGLMNLRTKTANRIIKDGHGDSAQDTIKNVSLEATHYSLDDASRLLGVSVGELKTSERQNVRGAAAALAHYARTYNNGQLPADLGGWYAAVAAYGGYTSTFLASSFADDVYSSIQTGIDLTTADGQKLHTVARPDAKTDQSALAKLNLRSDQPQTTAGGTDCPATLNCTFIPAGYGPNSDDPRDFGNWDPADRPNDLKIRYIIIHDTEGSYQSSLEWMQNTASYVSTHYLIKSSDGSITQMVRLQDVAWTAGNWFMNPHSINIEHEGFAAEGQVWYTEAMYRSSAKLVRWLADKYDIPLDRQHILGHDDIPRLDPARMDDAHWDPGPYWDWDHYMELLRAPELPSKPVTDRTKVVTITPNFATNQPPIKECANGVCIDLPAQGTNMVYLRTEPRADAPLLNDPYLHPDGSPGTNEIGDWSATADSGSKYAVADKQGDWTAIWYGGKVGWFFNPRGEGKTASASRSKVVMAKQGRDTIPVYAGAYPESAAYPVTIPDQTLTPIYTMPAGQAYTTAQKELSDYFYDATYNFSLPDDHMIVRGEDKYYRIMFNHRVGYVKTTDVDIKSGSLW